jgi:hypothetical protein
MTRVSSSVSAQDSLRTQKIPDNIRDYSEDSFSKCQLSSGVFWRGGLTGASKWGGGLNYKFTDGTSSDSYTIGFAPHLTFNINRNIGIVSGFELIRYSGEATGNFMDTYKMSISETNSLDFTYNLRNYSEQQNITLLSFPVMIKFSTNTYTKLFAAGGFKIGIPVKRVATIRSGILTTTALGRPENIFYHDVPGLGYVTDFYILEQQSKIDMSVVVAAAFEIGVKFTSDERICAGVSFYVDYGLNNFLKSGNRHMVEYQLQTPEQLRFNSITMTNRLNSVNLFSIGMKLRVNFNLGEILYIK